MKGLCVKYQDHTHVKVVHSHMKWHCKHQGDLASTLGIRIVRVCMVLGIWEWGLMVINEWWVLRVYKQGLKVAWNLRLTNKGQI